jgi:hypothetical protein
MAGTPVFGTSDLLSLGADWEVQSNSLGGGGQFARAEAVGADGDVVGHNLHDGVSSTLGRASGTITAIYIGSATDYGTPSTGALDGFLPGTVVAPYVITGITIDYSPCAAGQRETVTFAVSKTSLTASSNTYSPSLTTALVTKQEGAGIPSLLTAAGADSEAQSCTYALTCQVASTLDKVGNDIPDAGATYKGEETISQSYVGDPGAVTAPTGFLVTVSPTSDTADKTNNGYDTYNATAVAFVARD